MESKEQQKLYVFSIHKKIKTSMIKFKIIVQKTIFQEKIKRAFVMPYKIINLLLLLNSDLFSFFIFLNFYEQCLCFNHAVLVSLFFKLVFYVLTAKLIEEDEHSTDGEGLQKNDGHASKKATEALIHVYLF